MNLDEEQSPSIEKWFCKKCHLTYKLKIVRKKQCTNCKGFIIDQDPDDESLDEEQVIKKVPKDLMFNDLSSINYANMDFNMHWPLIRNQSARIKSKSQTFHSELIAGILTKVFEIIEIKECIKNLTNKNDTGSKYCSESCGKGEANKYLPRIIYDTMDQTTSPPPPPPLRGLYLFTLYLNLYF